MKVYNQCCKNCLLSKNRIVSAKRAKEIINTCAKNQSHFICHKASMNNEDVVCKTFYDKLGHLSQMIRISERIGAIKMIDQPDHEKLTSFNEMNFTP